jgi:cysteine-rich repeat protein
MAQTDSCHNDCTDPYCGDGFIWQGVEDCEDGNMINTDACTSACLDAACGDGFLWQGMETCDDGNQNNGDLCPGSCEPAFCGDGFTQMGVEECDDGNQVEDDACTTNCESNYIPLGTILLGGSSYSNINTALNTVGEPFMVMQTQWLPPNSANVLIMANDGGNANGPDYTAHLDSGKHVLIFGGSGLDAYRTYWTSYFSIAVGFNWHQSNDCMQDWNKTMPHPLTATVPDTYEFPNVSASYHMMHFNAAGQPGNTTILGQTCHQGPNNITLLTRKYANNGTLTYMAFDLGPYGSGNIQGQFLVPFLQSYFNWLQSGAP